MDFATVVLDRLRQHHPATCVVHRDLSATPPRLVDAAFCAAILGQDPDRAAFAESERLIEELDRADAVVLATPMHNYAVPAVLKAWIDQVVRIHRSFASTPEGKVGRLRDRPVFIIVASGGWFTRASPSGTPAQPDFLTPHLTAVFNTIGLRQIRYLTLEGLARGPEMQARALTEAHAALDQVLPGSDLLRSNRPELIVSSS